MLTDGSYTARCSMGVVEATCRAKSPPTLCPMSRAAPVSATTEAMSPASVSSP